MHAYHFASRFDRFPSTAFALAVAFAVVTAPSARAGEQTIARPGAAVGPGIELLERQVFQSIDGHVNEPARLAPHPGLVRRLQLPRGFRIAPFAEKLEAPRMMAVNTNGDVYVTRRHPHNDVLLLRDGDGNGVAETVRPVAMIENVHGIALREGQVFLAAVRRLYVAAILPDGGLGEPRPLYGDLPDAGQHPNRTLRFAPDGRLFLSVGSTNNAAPEPNPESATMLVVATDGSGRAVFARGLRNTIGFDWHPGTGEMWGLDHGIDWLGDNVHREELNLLVGGADYGWPFIYDDQQFNRHQNPEETTGLTWEEYAARTAPPVLGLTPHTAPMDMLFYTGSQFPAHYRDYAFLALHGSWNRADPKGYKVVTIYFRDGQPARRGQLSHGFPPAGPKGAGEFRPAVRPRDREGRRLAR